MTASFPVSFAPPQKGFWQLILNHPKQLPNRSILILNQDSWLTVAQAARCVQHGVFICMVMHGMKLDTFLPSHPAGTRWVPTKYHSKKVKQSNTAIPKTKRLGYPAL
jgi:hypothetical protein